MHPGKHATCRGRSVENRGFGAFACSFSPRYGARMEPSFIDAFKQNPLFFLIGILLGGLGLALAITAMVFAGRGSKVGIVLGFVAILSGLGALTSGVVGWMFGRSGIEAAAQSPGLSAGDRARLIQAGYAESLYSLELGIAASALPLLAGMTACAVGIAKRKRD